MIKEIESLKKQVQELRGNEDIPEGSEEKFVKTFNSSPSPMIISEIETGKVVDVNNAFANMIMYSRQELIGKSVLKLNLWANPKDREYYVKKMKDDKRISNHEIELRTKSGDIRATLISGEIIEIKGKNYLFTSGTDITERKHSEIALEKSEEKLRAIFDSAADGIVETDISGNILKVNKAIFRIYGSDSEEDYIGKSALEFYAPFDKMRALNAYRQTYYESIVEESEFTALKVDGTPFPVQITSAVLRDADEKPIGFVGIIKDITERKKAEDALFESEKKFRQFAENIEDVFWMSTPGVKEMLYVSPAYEKIWGRSCESLYKSPQSFMSAIHPDDQQHVQKELKKHAIGKWGPIEYRIIQPDESVRWIMDRGFTIFNEQDKIRYLLGTASDITQRKQAEEALKESEEKFRRLAENAPDIIYRFRVSPNPGFEFISPAVTEIAGYTPQEYYDNPELGLQIIHPDDRSKISGLYKGVIPEGPHQVRWIRKDGKIIWTEDRTISIYKEKGEFIAVEGIAREITAQKEAEEALKEAYDIINKSPAIPFLWKNEEGWPVEYVSENAVDLFEYTAEEFNSGKVKYSEINSSGRFGIELEMK